MYVLLFDQTECTYLLPEPLSLSGVKALRNLHSVGIIFLLKMIKLIKKNSYMKGATMNGVNN